MSETLAAEEASDGSYTKARSQPLPMDPAKIRRAQKAFQARSGIEAIEWALDFAIAENGKNRLTLAATERFVKSGIQIRDVYNTLGS